ncbi:MAG: hypothetical protein AB7U20_09900 [Planctomycetaceae bacterium]
MRRLLLCLALVIGAMAAGPLITPADACPMCKYANENNQNSPAEQARPRAYMYSILFMLSMPATMFAGYSITFYRMWKKQQELMQVSLDPPDV